MTSDTQDNKKFSHTKELVKLAAEDDMAPKDIARLCRVSQSVVSGCLNGTSRAKTSVIKPLIERYGHRLSRVAGRFYFAEGPPPDRATWEASEPVKRLRAWSKPTLTDDVRATLVEVLGSHSRVIASGSEEDAVQCALEELWDRESHPVVVRVDGPIVFRHVFRGWLVLAKHRRIDSETTAWGRCIVHDAGPGQFQLIVQRPRLLRGRARFSEMKRVDAEAYGRGTDNTGDSLLRKLAFWYRVDCADDEGRWLATIEGPLDLEALIDRIDTLARPEAGLASPSDTMTLPLLARKALMQLGYNPPQLGTKRVAPPTGTTMSAVEPTSSA